MAKPRPINKPKDLGADDPHGTEEALLLQPRPNLWLAAPGEGVRGAAASGPEALGAPGALEPERIVSPWRGRVAVFIDGLSLFYGARKLGIELDYIQLLRYFSREGRLLHAFFYAGIDEALETSRQQGFLTWMRHHGYRVITKAVQHFPDGNKKLDIDVEIAVDMMKLSEHCDTIVLVSGHDTLAYAVRRVSDRGVRVELLGLDNLTSPGLLNLVDDYSDLADIQDRVRLSGAS